MRAKVTDFKINDLKKFECRDRLPNLMKSMQLNLKNPYRKLLSIWTDDNKLLFIGGINEIHNGVGEAWMIGSKDIEGNKYTTFYMASKLIDFCFLNLNYHRVQIAVDPKWDSGLKWASKLGFTLEGLARGYSYNGEDHYMFARVKRRVV